MPIGTKIFGIGLSKTGTTSLVAGLRKLGFSAKHLPLAKKDFHRFQAFSDSSVAVKFQQLDQLFPGSKFIYTIREEESWLQSCRRHFAGVTHRPKLRAVRFQLYGCNRFDEQLFRMAYRWHDLKVRRFFRGRSSSLLILDLVQQADACWDQLCPFLGCEHPGIPFPWKNKTR